MGVLCTCPLCLLILSSVQYMVKVILTHIPVVCGVVEPYVHRYFDGSG